MSILRTDRDLSRTRIGTAVVILLFACSAIAHAQEGKDKKKKGESTPPAATAARRAPQPREAAKPKSGQTAQQNTARPNRPDSGRSTRQETVRPTRRDSGQSTHQENVRSNRRDPVEKTPQDKARPNHREKVQKTPQNAVRPDRPNTSQPGRDQGRPGVQNAGQNTRQNPGRHQPDSRGGDPRPQAVRTSSGGMVHRDARGEVRQVHTPGGAVITHRPDGTRHIEMVRPGNRTIVTNSHGRGGYIQRPFLASKRQYIQRTYSVHGVAYARVYRPVVFRGVSMHVYTPMHFFRPAFYSYFYSPWARPIFYDWAWSGSPWFGYYRGYFTPYPSYASPTFWLTDYLIGTTLEHAYEARMESAGFAPGGQIGITPDVKQAIAEEVGRQIELERSESQSRDAAYGDGPSMFSDNARHVFVASDALEVSSGGGPCTIGEVDVLQLYGAPPSAAANADVVVLAARGTDCRRGTIASVPIQDLQEMQNDMRATIDQGLAEFQARHGKSGLPKLPHSAAGVVNASFAKSVTPDANVATELTQVAQEAEQSERDVVNQANATGGSSGPVTISLGQTIEEVVALLSQPEKVVDLGARKIYVYQDIKVTFTDGKVSDVQ